MRKFDNSKKTRLVRQAKKKGLKRNQRRELLRQRKKANGSVSRSVIRNTALMKRIKKESARRAETRTSGATARAKGSPTSRSSGAIKRIWNRMTGK